MTNELLINTIYERVISVVLIGIDTEYVEEISAAYKEYLKDTYGNFDMQGKTYTDVISIFCDLEVSKWRNCNAMAKLTELLKDDALENIRQISAVAANRASDRLSKRVLGDTESVLPPSISEDVADENISLLETNLQNVRDFNSKLALSLVSEGILDFEYACGRTENMSMRTGRINIK